MDTGRWLRPDITRHVAALALAAAIALVGCTGGGGTPPPGEPDALRVVATTTVLADLVHQVGGPRVQVHSLVPKGGEVHTFDPAPSDIAKVADADLIVMNGLGLDDWLADLAADAGAGSTPIVKLGEDLDGVTYLDGVAEDDLAAARGDAQAVNPHLWLNVAYTQRYVDKLADALTAADPASAATYDTNTAAYQERLRALDAWARDSIAAVPAQDRRIVSFHEAFPYLAHAYGLEVVGVAVHAPGQEPSAAEIAALIDAIRAANVKAIFSEAQFPAELVEQIAAETGARVESELYNDSLGDPPVDTYEGLIRWDVERIVEALT